MSFRTSFEILPDEIILCICQYLRGADVFYSFYNLNARLNITIAGYCRYVNLMAVSYKHFEYAVSHVLPEIGFFVRSFVLNGNWETIVNKKLSSILFSSNLPLLFPQLKRLIIKWFTSERFLSFIDIIHNFSQLTELDIRYLKGNTIDLLQLNILFSNDNRLEIISFDQDSIDFDISENQTDLSYPNIQDFTINLTESKLIPRVFLLLPNVRRLHINIEDLSDNSESKLPMIDLEILDHLIDFQLRSINLFWTFDETAHILKSMPSLQRLAFDIRTDDERLINGEDLSTILPLSLNKIDFFIRYYYPKSTIDVTVPTNFSSIRFPTVCLLDKPRYRFLIHTLPCDLHSAILTTTISKQMASGWKYTQQIQDLYIYDITSILDLLLILQHFRHLRVLSIDIKDKTEFLTLPPESQSIDLKLPFLTNIEISGICDLFPLLNASPNVDYLIVCFDCLKTILDNESTCYLLKKQIIRINITDWIDTNSDLLQRILQVFNSLRHLVITMKNPSILIEDFLLTIFSLLKEKSRISIDVKGSLLDETKKNLRQWLVDHSHIKADDSFALEYNDNWFDFWF